MKKGMFSLSILGVILLLSENVMGVPNYAGEKGLKNILSANPERAGKFNYNIGFRVLWTTSLDFVDSLMYLPDPDSDFVYTETGTEDRCWIGDILLGMGFSFTDFLSLNVYSAFLIDVARTSINNEGSGAVSYGMGDTYLGVKFTPTKIAHLFSPEFSKVFDFGIYPVVSFATGEEREGMEIRCAHDTVFGEPCRIQEGGIHRFYTAGSLTSGVKGLMTFNIQTEPQLSIHINGGYVSYPNPSIASKISYGIGLECIYPKFAPFVELYGEERESKEYNDGGLFVSPGLRFESAEDVWITLGMDFRLSSLKDEYNNKEYHIHGGFGSAPDWVFNLNISQGYDFRPLPPIGNAVIAGKVMDENSNPVRAVVFFSDTNVTTDIGGMYKIELPQGNVIAYAAPVNKNAYLPSEEITKYIAGGEKETINFRVKSKPKIEEKPAILTGRVTDKMSTAGLSATISFPETSFPSLKSDISGIYRTELPTGTYVVKIEKEGYTPQTHPVVCKQGGTIVLDVQLFSPPRGATIAGKVVDYASRKGIAATISFLGATIPDIKTDIETGIYKANIPDGTHQVKVESNGYVPEGQVIICKPGETVMKDFELFKKEEKIVLRGINFELNSAVILPSSYPVLDDAVSLLKKHPDVVVEIGGHTCSMGSDAHNLNLSQLRAESVRTYLVQQGISAQKLQTRGYGESMPMATNANEAGRSLNRRIEFRIISQ